MLFIWRLVKVLFFPVDKRELATKSDVEVHARRNAIAKWLTDWVQSDVGSDSSDQSNSPFKPILDYLTGHKVRDATREAYRSGNPRLAVLISQVKSHISFSCPRERERERERMTDPFLSRSRLMVPS